MDIIYHLAASSHVDRSITDPLTFVKDNVLATANILNYARSMDNLESMVYFSTDGFFAQQSLVNPLRSGIDNSTNPYSAAKAGGEETCHCF